MDLEDDDASKQRSNARHQDEDDEIEDEDERKSNLLEISSDSAGEAEHESDADEEDVAAAQAPNSAAKRVKIDINTGSTHLPLIEKYRPKEMADVVAQEDVTQTLDRLIANNALPHLLFYGPPGTGKTSTIKAMAARLYGSEAKVRQLTMELNASDERGIDDIREKVVAFAGTKQIFSTGMKLVILDEADNMTKDAQFALRRVIEKYASNARFCLICNYVSKIIPALQSRCTKFRFSPLAPALIANRVRDIAAQESIVVSESGMQSLLKLSTGDMRKVLNLLEACSMQQKSTQDNPIDTKLVYQVAGKPTPEDMTHVLDVLMNRDVAAAVQILGEVQIQSGLALTDIVTELLPMIMELKLPNAVACFLLKELGDAEHRLSLAVDDRLQLAGLVSIFMLAREKIRVGLESGR